MDDIMKEKVRFHRQNPQLGDYWSYDGQPSCVVVGVGHYAITICDEVFTDNGKLVWDFDKLQNWFPKDFESYIDNYTNEVCSNKFVNAVTTGMKEIVYV